MCQNSVLALYCKEWEPRYPPNKSKRLWFPWKPLRYPQTPPDIPQKPPRHLTDTPQTSPGNMTCKQRTTNANRHRQTYSSSTGRCLGVSGGVCWRLLMSVGMYCSLERPWGCLGNVWGVSGGIGVAVMKIGGAGMSLGGILVLSPCSMEPKHYFGTSSKCMTFFHLTILRH